MKSASAVHTEVPLPQDIWAKVARETLHDKPARGTPGRRSSGRAMTRLMRHLLYTAIVLAGAAAIAAAVVFGGSTGLVAQQPGGQAQADPGATAVPQRTETITYDSWTVTCRDTADGKSKRTCSGLLQVTDQKSGQVLLAWILGRSNEGALLTVLHTPTGVLVQNGVELKLGSGAARKLAYVSCDARQCETAAPMDDAIAREAAAATEAVVTIYTLDGRGINFNIPVKGTDKAIAAIGR